MATHKVERGHIGAYEKTLSANSADTVEFDANLSAVEVTKDEGEALYFTVDGPEPVVGGGFCHFLPAGIASVRVVPSKANSASADPTVVQLISAGTPTVSVSKVSN